MMVQENGEQKGEQMQDPLLSLEVHRVPQLIGDRGDFSVPYYFEGSPDTGLMRELVTLYHRYHYGSGKTITEVNWAALGSVRDDRQIERFLGALQDAFKLKKAIDNGLVVMNPTSGKLIGAYWWSL
jgi:hypothetical protein